MIFLLKKLYNVFSNFVMGIFVWVGVENVEIVLLNDFWWYLFIIVLGDLL